VDNRENSMFYEQYIRLPEAIRQYYSYHEYCWMSERQRNNLVADNTEPEEWDDD